jgi:uncharacterized membrane protein required for colicin V production
MTIWILALVLLAALAGLGYRQGAIRTVCSFAGIVLGVMLAAPLGRLLFKPLLPHLGVHSPIMIWLLPPLVAFVLIWIAFKAAGYTVHHKVTVYYKYQAGDLRLAFWNRLHHRLGLCVGLLNGAAWFVLISFVIFNFSYWTAQIASSDNETRTTQFINYLGRNLDNTGMDKVARTLAPMPPIYYKLADLAGLLIQNPDLDGRLGDYPAFLSLGERSDFQQLAQDKDFVSAWKHHAPAGQLLNDPQIKSILQNTDLVNTVWGLIRDNLDDLLTYLKTGQSPKYGSEKILGRWKFNAGVTAAMLLQSRPNIPAKEMRAARAWMQQIYAQTELVAGADGQVFLDNFPQVKPGKPPTVETATLQGKWKSDGDGYDLSLNGNGQTKSMSASTDGLRLKIKTDEQTLVFDRME